MPERKDFAPGEFCWVDLSAHDMKAACPWYADLFGWQHQEVEQPGGGPPYAFFMKGGAAIGGIGQMDDAMKGQGIPPTWNSYINTDDCAAFEGKVRELGGAVNVPTMDGPGFGKLAFFMDPEGASFAAWQSTTDAGPGLLVGEPTGLCWNELMTRDSSKASDFYGKLTGWTFNSMPMDGIDYTMVQNEGKDAAGIMPMHGPQFEGIPAHWLVYFAVEDCKAAADKVASTGGTVAVPPTEIPVGTFACFLDPQGAAFAVIQMKEVPGA